MEHKNYEREGSFGVTTLLIALMISLQVHQTEGGQHLKTAVYHSPAFTLGPGSVENRYYHNIDFPRGHIALKSFDAEVVDESGISIPLHETYLHHWVVIREYVHMVVGHGAPVELTDRNAGICPNILGQWFGLGSETRETATWVPEPYGIEAGNPRKIPDGYEEQWMLNVHAIDTRGVEDRLGCTECRCSLYNVTIDEYGRSLSKDYVGGLLCCYDQTRCRLSQGLTDRSRKLFLRYTVKWMDWDDTIVPVKIYIFDVTYALADCKVEYQVEACGLKGVGEDACLDTKRTKVVFPHGGDIVYGVGHQHTGGVGAAIYGQDGRLLCSSVPRYGSGSEAGNEAGYIVGMSTCYPRPGSVTIADGETVTVESNYSSSQAHSGVMGLFYILVAEPQPRSMLAAPSGFMSRRVSV